MNTNIPAPGVGTYVVVLRVPTAFHLLENQDVRLHVETPRGSPAEVTFSTRYVDVGCDAKVPGHLSSEVRGEASDLRQAIDELGTVGTYLLAPLAVSVNAAVEHPVAELAFDATPGLKERPFYQNLIPDESGEIRRGCPLWMPSDLLGFCHIWRSLLRERNDSSEPVDNTS